MGILFCFLSVGFLPKYSLFFPYPAVCVGYTGEHSKAGRILGQFYFERNGVIHLGDPGFLNFTILLVDGVRFKIFGRTFYRNCASCVLSAKRMTSPETEPYTANRDILPNSPVQSAPESRRLSGHPYAVQWGLCWNWQGKGPGGRDAPGCPYWRGSVYGFPPAVLQL